MNTIQINPTTLLAASTKKLESFQDGIENYCANLIDELEKDNASRHPKQRYPILYVRHVALKLTEKRIEDAKALHKQILTACLVAEGLVTISFETAEKIFGE